MEREVKERELAKLKAAIRDLEVELGQLPPPQEPASAIWPPVQYYTAHYVLAGCVLGMLAACTSLLFNVVGSVLFDKDPLQLIRVYLSFAILPIDPRSPEAMKVASGMVLAIGCCLYLATGMVLGIPMQLLLTRWCGNASFGARFAVATGLGLALWVFNFYGMLSWLQPLLYGGRWIVEQIPWWVAALTHLVFAWTILLMQPLGVFVPYQVASKGNS